MSHTIEVKFKPASMVRNGRHTLITMNNVNQWLRWDKTKVKQEFISYIKEWIIPDYDDIVYKKADIVFQIERPNSKGIDSDAICGTTGKWVIDILVDKMYLSDDNHTRITYEPTVLNCDIRDTLVNMKATFYEEYTMTVAEMKETLEKALKEFENVGGENHVKAANRRLRGLLTEIRKATPAVKKQLIELDK